ncbi:MAG: class I SAM-dependent methyltransferase [bacterium]|nr:class I SAM-dependent methyltransferase [bacterium]
MRTQEREKRKIEAFICEECTAVYFEDYKKDRSYIYEDENYSPWGKEGETNEDIVALSKKETFKGYLFLLKRYIEPKGKKLLDIGTGKGYFLEIAQRLGFEIYGVEPSGYCSKTAQKKFGENILCGKIEDAKYGDERFDVITMTDLIEHISSPRSFLKEVNRVLKKDGVLLLTTPNFDSFTRKLLGKDWFQYKYEHIVYYNKKSIFYLLEKEGFKVLTIRNNVKRCKIEYYYYYFKQYSFCGIEKIIAAVFPYLPMFIKNLSFSNPITGEMIVVAQKM